MEDEAVVTDEAVEEKMVDVDVPMVTSFDELDAIEDAREVEAGMRRLVHQFGILADNIVVSASDKVGALKALASEFSQRLGQQMNDDKAVWSTAFVNNLPDSSFLWIAPGGKKDNEGKTLHVHAHQFQ